MNEAEPNVEHYEVEYKVEITEEERRKLIAALQEKDFAEKEPVTQNDFYIEGKVSSQGGYDIKRYRDEGDVIFYTEKIWVTVGEEKTRQETEREVSRKEFMEELEKYPNATKIKKERTEFAGEHEGEKIKIDMDSVKFDHSPSMRYFIETETLTDNKEEVAELKALVENFLKGVLGKSELVEAPGMFTMAFKKI